MKWVYKLRAALISASLLFAGVASAELEIVELYYRNATEMQGLLQALDPNLKMTATGNQLILKGDPEAIAQAKDLISQLDVKPHQFLVSVTYDEEFALRENAAMAQAHISNDSAQIGAQIQHYETNHRDNRVYQARGLENKPIWIQTGTAKPHWTATHLDPVTGQPLGIQAQQLTANSGFYAKARANPPEVTIEINPQIAKFQGDRIRHQQISTQVNGELGTWIGIGGVDRSSQSQTSGLAHHAKTRTKEGYNFYIKVDLLP